jgi:hypothetical protein
MSKLIATCCGFLLLAGSLLATDLGAAEPAEPKAGEPAGPKFDKEKLHKEFEQTMSGSVLRGYFTARDNPQQGALREEKYTISKVTKLPGDNDQWEFNVRIQYGKFDAELPLKLDVIWSGDTPVITLTDYVVLGFGKLSARVLVYRGQYTGVWEGGGDHGGHLFGQVEKLRAEKTEKK